MEINIDSIEFKGKVELEINSTGFRYFNPTDEKTGEEFQVVGGMLWHHTIYYNKVLDLTISHRDRIATLTEEREFKLKNLKGVGNL